MANGRHKSDWQHTASILCILANINRDPKKSRAYKPQDFDPTVKRSRRSKGRAISFSKFVDDFMRPFEGKR